MKIKIKRVDNGFILKTKKSGFAYHSDNTHDVFSNIDDVIEKVVDIIKKGI